MMPLVRQINTLSADMITGTNFELPDAAITLTRTNSLSIPASTDIPWEVKTRGQNITWTTTDVTIPAEGYYHIQLMFTTAASVLMNMELVYNGTSLGRIGQTWTTQTYHYANTLRYLFVNDVIRLRVIPGAATTIQVVNEFALTASPILHVVQVARQALT